MERSPRFVIPLIVVGLVAWGVFHAVGAYRFNQNPWRGIVVLAFSGAFIGFWLLLLRSRSRRTD